MTELEKLVARVMSTAFIEPVTPTAGLSKKKQKKLKRHHLLKKADNMTEEQQKLLLAMLSGTVATVSMHGENYVYRRSDSGWMIRSLHDDEPEHTVLVDFSACSCQDNKFRGRVCKHMATLKEIMT
jgi:hypothetical protein